MIKKDHVYEIEIIDMADTGSGVGKIDLMTVFVEGAITGDIANVKIDLVKKNYASGKAISFVKNSDFRINTKCPVAIDCGGCQIQHMDYNEQLNMKTNMVKQVLKRIGKLENVVVEDTIGMQDPYFYRNKAQFPVANNNGVIEMGFYKKKSHEIVAFDDCFIQDPLNKEILKCVKEYMQENNISAYDEKTHSGFVRHVVTKVGRYTKQVMVVIVTASSKIDNISSLVEKLKSRIEGFYTLVQNINKDKTNRILGFKSKIHYGNGYIFDKIGNLKFKISPLSFFQVNPIQTKVLYDTALEFADLSSSEVVFDIYSGIGSISLFLAQKAKSVIGVEIVEDAVEDAKENAKLNGVKNVEFYLGKAEEVIPRLYKEGNVADVVVVDPPRKGCDALVLDTMIKMNPKKIVYVSCNPATLARDINYLKDFGYKVEKVQPVDMFPHSMHVECVVGIRRKDSL